MVYAKLDETGRIVNTAVWVTEPEAWFAPFVAVPDDMPAGIGDYWDGEHFRRGGPDGEVIEPYVEPEPVEPEPSLLDDALEVLELLGLVEEVEDA